MENLNNSTIIKNISYNQDEILYNIMRLYNNGEGFDADITASQLKFYNVEGKEKEFSVPVPKYLFDVCPQSDNITKIEPFNKLPLADGAIKSVVVDLPFVICPKTCKSAMEKKEKTNMIFNRFSSWYPAMEAYENMYWWIKECFRVLADDGIVVWKMQSTVSGGINHWFTPFSMMCAQKMGFYVIDEFILEAKSRLISASKYKAQKHARKYTSTFLVFKKDSKRADKTNIFTLLEECEKNVYEGKKWELK